MACVSEGFNFNVFSEGSHYKRDYICVCGQLPSPAQVHSKVNLTNKYPIRTVLLRIISMTSSTSFDHTIQDMSND